MIAKRTSKNQITLPKSVLKDFQDIEYFDVTTRAGEIVLHPVSVLPSAKRLSMARDKIEKLGITSEDLLKAIQWARKEG